MFRTSMRNGCQLVIDEMVYRAVRLHSEEEAFGDSNGYGFYALIDISERDNSDLNDDECSFFETHPWAILRSCDDYINVDYYHSERAARDDWFLQQLSYDQHMAEVEKDSE